MLETCVIILGEVFMGTGRREEEDFMGEIEKHENIYNLKEESELAVKDLEVFNIFLLRKLKKIF